MGKSLKSFEFESMNKTLFKKAEWANMNKGELIKIEIKQDGRKLIQIQIEVFLATITYKSDYFMIVQTLLGNKIHTLNFSDYVTGDFTIERT